MNRAALRVFLALSFIACALTASSDDRFVIERIDVRNAAWVDPRLVANESMLREGATVSEEDVRDAVRRLARTPFIFSATYALEPGSDPGRRVVVLTVTENRRAWFLLDGRFTQFHVPSDLLDYEYPDPSAEWKDAAAGARWMYGDGGLAHVGMTVRRNRLPIGKNYSAWEVGYTRHSILGTPLFATAMVRSPVDSMSEGTFTPEIVLGLPLSANQTLSARLEDTMFRRETIHYGDTSLDRLHFERSITAAWTFETRDEPYAPMRGTYVRVEPGLWMMDFASFQRALPPDQPRPFATHDKALLLNLVAEQHWQRSDVSSISASLEAAWAKLDERGSSSTGNDGDRGWRTSYEVVRGGYSRRLGESVLQVEGRVFLRQASLPELSDEIGPDITKTAYEAAASWVRRSRWGTLRIGVTWVSDDN